MSNHIRKWASGEILTDTSPADRRALQDFVDQYDAALTRIEQLQNEVLLWSADYGAEAATVDRLHNLLVEINTALHINILADHHIANPSHNKDQCHGVVAYEVKYNFDKVREKLKEVLGGQNE